MQRSWSIQRGKGFIFLWGVISLAALASPEDQAKSFMSDLVEVAQLSQKQETPDANIKERIRSLSSRIDFTTLAQSSWGSARWKKFSKTDRKEFLDTLQELLEEVVYPNARKVAVRPEDLSYTPGKGHRVNVQGRVVREKKGERVTQSVEVGLIYDRKDHKIVDAVIEGEVLSANLKRQFNEALKKQSFAQIIQKMKKRVAEAQKGRS